MEPNAHERPANGTPPAGEALAVEMLRQLTILNANIQKSHELYERLADGIADLTDYHETYMRATEILIEKADGGKIKFSGKDFVEALADAAAEVMGDEEDEPGDEDPLVESGRRP